MNPPGVLLVREGPRHEHHRTTVATELVGEPVKTIAGRTGRRWWLLLIPGIAWIVIASPSSGTPPSSS